MTVRIDAGAPETDDDAPAGWRNADTTVTLTPTDTLSGITGGLAATTWELDGGATQAGTSVLVAAPSDHSGDGARAITYRSTDAAGNREADKTATVLVDTLAPATRDDLASGPPAHTDPVTVTLSASDENGALDVSGVAATHYPRGRRRLADRDFGGGHRRRRAHRQLLLHRQRRQRRGRQDLLDADDRHHAARRQQRRRSGRLGEPRRDR